MGCSKEAKPSNQKAQYTKVHIEQLDILCTVFDVINDVLLAMGGF